MIMYYKLNTTAIEGVAHFMVLIAGFKTSHSRLNTTH